MRLLLIDDHALFVEGLTAFLGVSRPAWRVAQALSADQGLGLFGDGGGFDLTLLDLNLPDAPGLEVLARLLAVAPGAPVLVLSAETGPDVEARVLAAGAVGFLGKAAPPARLLAAIETLADAVMAQAEDDIGGAGFTARQKQVLELLAQGCSNKEIQFRLGIAPRTVTAHLTQLFRLLDATSRTQALINARARGMIG